MGGVLDAYLVLDAHLNVIHANTHEANISPIIGLAKACFARLNMSTVESKDAYVFILNVLELITKKGVHQMNQEPDRKEMTLRLTWPEYDAINAARKQFSPHVRENFHSCVRRLLAEALEAHDQKGE